ncbi:MAG: hypothetical protein BGN94_24415 [Rhizobiales bacterium 68-8]|nr:MAG: hypothetical protein BGN94_24415 [Rhizobiales bacterium 68-8]
MQSAPFLICWRTASVTPSGPSASSERSIQPCPPVIAIASPAARMRGPRMTPRSTISRSAKICSPPAPASLIVVMPARMAEASEGTPCKVWYATVRGSRAPGRARLPGATWVCMSIRPGRAVQPG